MSSSSAAFSLDLLASPPSSQLCYVHCNCCDTILAVSVPRSNLFKPAVTVRCGHCTNLLPVNMRALLLPAANQLHPFLSPMAHNSLLDGMSPPPPPPPPMFQMVEQHPCNLQPATTNTPTFSPSTTLKTLIHQENLPPAAPVVNKPLEKRQRVPSAYNRFIKDEIQRIKAGNPDITHREAFSAAAKNWAHFPHIHFGVAPEQVLMKKNSGAARMQVDGGDGGLYAAAAANMGVFPF